MKKQERIEIPDNPAGRLIFDMFKRLAIEMCEIADEATKDFMIMNFPTAETIRKEYINRQYRRVIELGGKHIIVIAYDFKTRTTIAFELPSIMSEQIK